MESLSKHRGIILLTLVAIFFLIYFFATADNSRPEKCYFEQGINCLGFNLTNSTITIALQNGVGTDLTVARVYDKNGKCSSEGGNMADTESQEYALTNCRHPKKGKFYTTLIRVEYAGTPHNGTYEGTVEGYIR